KFCQRGVGVLNETHFFLVPCRPLCAHILAAWPNNRPILLPKVGCKDEEFQKSCETTCGRPFGGRYNLPSPQTLRQRACLSQYALVFPKRCRYGARPCNPFLFGKDHATWPKNEMRMRTGETPRTAVPSFCWRANPCAMPPTTITSAPTSAKETKA